MAAELPVLLLAPTEGDAKYTRAILTEAGIPHEVFRSLGELLDATGEETGAIVLSDASLASESTERLEATLHAQPSWSELPVVVLTTGAQSSPVARRALETLGNVTLVERPVGVPVLVSILRSALRARRHQHQVRDQLGEVAELNRQLERLAFYDTLTGLPNRDLLRDRLAKEMARVRRHGGACAVLFLDFDDFKTLNDSLGHDLGDRALQIIAERLPAFLRDEDTAARLGGDEFVVVLSGVHGPRDAAKVAGELLRSVAEPFLLRGQEVRLTSSMGIALYAGGDETLDEVLKRADQAMYHAKFRGKSQFAFFTEGLD